MALYFLSNICLLADVFQSFKNNSLKRYKLISAYNGGVPKLVWSAFFKHIDRPIPLIIDQKMYQMIKPYIHGGICNAIVCYVCANKIMSLLYNLQQPSLTIIKVNAIIFYFWAISKKMPDQNLEWVSLE